MVLESLLNPRKAEGKPWETFFIGIVYSSIAIFLSLWIFHDYASLVMVFLTVIASVPLMYNIIALEEEKNLEISSEKILVKEHWKAISVFIFLFLGFLASFTIWYVVLPTATTENVFDVQLKTIENINAGVTAIITGKGIYSNFFMSIISNNIKVMIFCILFAFIFGAGAIFILTWNASVIAAAIGSFIRENISSVAANQGWDQVTGYFYVGSSGFLRYLIHGIPEITAYFLAGLAGGIISIAVIRHDFGTDRFRKIVIDSLDLIILAFMVLFTAAIIEVFITPLIF